MSPAQQRGLALWASLLSALVCLLFLPVPRWGAWLILLVTLALIIGIWRIASRRTGRNVASTLASPGGRLSPAGGPRLRRPAVCLAASVTGASRQTGLLDPRGKDGGSAAGRAPGIEPAAGMGASAVGAALRLPAAACAKRCADQRSAGPALATQPAASADGYAVPLALQGQVGSAMSRDLLWQAAIPGEAVKVWQPSCAPVPYRPGKRRRGGRAGAAGADEQPDGLV